VLVMTRWHSQDLAGLLTAEMTEGTGEQWEVISLPAEAEENDALGREVGAWLWPDRFSPEEYAATKSAVGSRAWAALYQQRPSPEEGGLIKRQWFQYYTVVPAHFDTILQSWDCTFKDLKSSDYVVGQVWGQVGADKYLLDQVRDKMDLPKTLMAVRRMSVKWPQARLKLIEDKANGPAVIQMLKKEISGLVAVNPEGGKVARVNAICPDIESGNVWLPHKSIAHWIELFVEECAVFPNGANDDQVDAMSQGLNRMIGRRGLRAVRSLY
jgi:predicted phage terminase large subunit-like protein